MKILLDVNALLALRYDAHVHHSRVHQWLSQLDPEPGCDHAICAICPITELGFVRVGSGKAGYAADVDTAREHLEELKSSMEMLFIPDDLPTRHFPPWVRKSAQATDGYLLALARPTTAVLQRWTGSSQVPCSSPRKPRGRSWCIGEDYEAFRKFLIDEDDGLPPGMATEGSPGPGIAFSNLHCATTEEADAAHVAFLREVWEIADEDL